MSSKTCGAAIVGAGVIFQEHARAFSQLAPRIRLIGLADLDAVRARRTAQGFFVPVVTEDYRELLAREDIDVVSVCTPPSSHEQIVVDALEAGKHVLCEKPLAHSLAAADRILEAAQRHPNRLSVVYQKRFAPEVRRAMWLVDEGHLGRIQFGSFSLVSHIPVQHQGGDSWWGQWNVAGGGSLMTQCIHELDLQLLLFGPARRVRASMATLASPIDSEDTISATVEHESGAIVSVGSAAGHRVGARVNWVVMGADAAVHYPWAINSTDRHLRDHLLRESVKRFPEPGKRQILPGKLAKVVRLAKRKLGMGKLQLPTAHKPYVEAVLNAMDADSPLPVSPEAARQSLELCTAIYTAAITGETVDLPLGSESPFYQGITAEDYRNGRRQPELEEVH